MGQRYFVREAKTKQELDSILDVIWAANYTPYEPFMQLIFPVLGYTAAHREAAINESKQRFWEQHQADETIHWFYAFDTVTNRAVGCAQWVVSTTNPFAAGTPDLKAPWWPEGEYRSFCESILNQVYKPRANWMARPHCCEWSTSFFVHMRYFRGPTRSRIVGTILFAQPLTRQIALNWMAVDPAHRLRGIGCLLMDVGVTRADELDLECWMEASAMGRPLYEKFGFQSLLKIAFDTDKPNASDEWRKSVHELTPEPIHAMWRPAKSLQQNSRGELQMPWTLGTRP